MIYCKTINKEVIAVHPMNDMKNTQFIELIKDGENTVFYVWMDDGKDEWFWEFDMSCPSDYERVKLNIFDTIFECDTMIELALTLDEVFRDGFMRVLIEENECEDCIHQEVCKFSN